MTRHELHTYDYVNHAYAEVRDALLADPLAIFAKATSATGTGAKLEVKIGALEVGADVAIEVHRIVTARSPIDKPSTQIEIRWTAAKRPGLFPTLTATLAIYALSPTETQLELSGTYEPPLGIAGEALDAIALHRVAEQSVTNFVREVAQYLRNALREAQASA
jgi:hypothetical protein